jgi:colanic acid/amylovoran biosynthesis glycosyltransferase
MKIAFFVTEFPSLSQTFILNQITGLLDRGHDVTIYARVHRVQPFVHTDVERYRLLDRMCSYGDCYSTMPARKLLRLAKSAYLVTTHFRKQPINLARSLNILISRHTVPSPYVLCSVAASLNSSLHSYDIVHCHFGPNGNLGAWLKYLGVIEGKFVTTFHGYDISKYVRKKGDRVYDPLFETGDLLLPVSERWKRALVQLGCEEQKIVVHKMGVDLDRFSFTPRKLREDGKVHVLSIGRFVEKKGVQYSIQAVAKLLEKYPNIEYKIVGDGLLRHELQSLIDAFGINSHVKLLGWKRHEEIAELMRDGDIFLAPSVTSSEGDQEGIPVVLMEALARGLPVVSTLHSGIPELVQDGEAGFLVPERDVDALAEKLEYLIEHPQIWPKMGRAGREYVARHHDIDKLNDQLVNLYRRLLDREPPSKTMQNARYSKNLSA